MKINTPVTNRNVDVRNDQIILSTTDLKGSITYINQDFVDISGFQNEELIGKNHNIIRHPDMPPAAFEELWTKIKAGKPWMGIVKNRCKNGDHYWIDAFVMPILKDGAVVEYQSVRYRAKSNWVERAEPIYKALLAGKSFKAGFLSSLSLTNKLIIGNLVALLPVLLTLLIPALNAFSPLGLVLTALLSMGINWSLLAGFRKLVQRSHEVVDQPVMRHIYTGSDDETAQIELALKMYESQINAIVGRMTDATQKMHAVADINVQTSQQTRQGMDAQQNELTQVATAMTEMAATVQEIAANASAAADSTRIGQKQAGSGKDVVEKTIKAINVLAVDIQHTSEVIQKLSTHSEEIAKILEVIKGIAEQTNLLALNAAIEAARAGENGRGFAVVADEVRTLASRTTESAREIEEMIELLQNGSKEAVSAMDKNREKAESSVDLAAKAGEALEAISGAIDTITEMNTQIETASEEQSTVAEEMNKNVLNISQVADSTAVDAKQVDEKTRETLGTIEQLSHLVGQFMHKS
ncbi:MAG: methyl-accepting chemotaxis protein [Candidatus Thiodiazotropha endolucinida]|nr:methyl-accepting chemotaxis protein [Candidatus Thiodiazotropha taylori]MCW4276242.1 methyl-accepting chemotaxis protein [Candidatus Thiodiazotropha taylori]